MRLLSIFFVLLVSTVWSQTPGNKTFTHPGILVNREMLDFVKEKIKAGEDPWKTAFEQMRRSKFASLSYKPGAIDTVRCGPYSKPDFGCKEEKDDVVASYTHALLWSFTDDKRYAEKAIEIMNNWSSTIRSHTLHNAPLQSAWCASVFPRAAEIIKHTNAGWDAENIHRFEQMLKNVYLPLIIDGHPTYNGNWELSMIEAVIASGVFLDDRGIFDKGIDMWRKRVPAYIYMESDGPLPVPPPRGKKEARDVLIKHWYAQEKFVNGLGQETCRDLGHMQYGLAAMVNAAETARLQGLDLYAEESNRIVAGLEFHAQFLNRQKVPDWLCKGKLKAVEDLPMWEIAVNEYVKRKGMSLPHSEGVLVRLRPSGTNHHMAWETLTHAGLGSVGVSNEHRSPSIRR